jgi:ribosomal protein S18 acetylase RimI-like enzyme
MYRIYAEHITKKAYSKKQILIAKEIIYFTGYLIWEDFHNPLVEGMTPNPEVYKMIAPEITYVEMLEENLHKVIDTDKNRIARLTQVAVIPVYENRGIATMLADKAISQIIERNYQYIIADCTADNSWHILEKLGFKIISEIAYKDFNYEGENPFSDLQGTRRLVLKEI